MSNFLQITPFMHVQDLDPALRFFTDILGFKVAFRSSAPGYAYVEREGVAFRILEASEARYGEREYAYYIDLRDVDALYAELKPKLDTLPKSHVMGPFDQPYLQRELLVRAPDGNIIAFGQAIKRP
jgi:catechol 2,3-dioxygenase-like lactoylglutathione lyase family enzyme